MSLGLSQLSPDDGVMSLGLSQLSLDEESCLLACLNCLLMKSRVFWLCDLLVPTYVTDNEQNRGVDKHKIRSMKKREHKL